jgi:hypothetical protein
MKKIVIVVIVLLCGIAAADGSGAPTLEAAKQECTAAINDPTYKESIRKFLDQQLDVDTIKAHEDALHHIQKNESHVIYAYAALWAIAALLVGFLFLRQQALKTEILALKRDLSKAEDKT